MQPSDLAPFAHSLGLSGIFALPRAPLTVAGGGFAWWDVDAEVRARAHRAGGRDLATAEPVGRGLARRKILDWLNALPADLKSGPLILGGFSQGGMLAGDAYLMEGLKLSALIMLSASRIAINDWSPRLSRAKGLPVFISHGEQDDDLSFSAGRELADTFRNAGASVTFVPFPGRHEIPLLVWRALRAFLRPFCDARTTPLDSIDG